MKKRAEFSESQPTGPDPLRFCQPKAAPEGRHAAVATAAYLRAQGRHFEAGHELEDWLAAEVEFDRQSTAISA